MAWARIRCRTSRAFSLRFVQMVCGVLVVTFPPNDEPGLNGRCGQLVNEECKRIWPTKDLNDLFLCHDAHPSFAPLGWSGAI